MEKTKENPLKKFLNKMYGGLSMSWPAVIIFAVASAILTAVFLLVPVFSGTSFEQVGVTFEAWIFFAVIIMANCKKPLESALKTFVFFLISQPLIYLIQVPFSSAGWGLFSYYKYWFLLTLLTFPMAFAGWYIKKKNWLSLLILLPVLCYLCVNAFNGARELPHTFPRMILMIIFCLAQVIIYVMLFTGGKWQKLVGFLVPAAVALALMLLNPAVNVSATDFLPDDRVLSEEAVLVMEDGPGSDKDIRVSISSYESGLVRVEATEYGTVAFSIRDGDDLRYYTATVYDDGGVTRIRIENTPTN